jgi:hypothetical protein
MSCATSPEKAKVIKISKLASFFLKIKNSKESISANIPSPKKVNFEKKLSSHWL